MESEEEAEKWLHKLDSPITGTSRTKRGGGDNFDDINQLKNL